MTRLLPTRSWVLLGCVAPAFGVGATADPQDPSAYERAVLARNPVAYWRLGEAKGTTIFDKGPNRHHGTVHGKMTFGVRGALRGDMDTAIKLDGLHSYVEVPAHKDFSLPTSGKGLTVEVWMRPDRLEFEGATESPYIFWLGKGEPKRHEWALRFYSSRSKDRPNRISAYAYNLEGGLGAGAYFQDQLTAGEWIHVVACFDPGDASTKGAGVRIYKNGKLRQGPPSSATLYGNRRWQIKPAAGDAPLRLGTRNLGHFLVGALDEVAIYPRVLSADEVLENYSIGKGE